MHRLRDLVGDPDDVDFDEPTNGVVEMPLPDLEESGDQPTTEPLVAKVEAMRAQLDTILLDIERRLARLEASNG